MSIPEGIKKNWVTIVLAVISAGWFADTIGLLKFNREISQADKAFIIKELREDRNYYQDLYRDCNHKFAQLQEDVTFLRSNLNVVGAISNDLPLPMWLKDLDGRLLFVNDAYVNEFLKPRGYSIEDYIGKTDYAVWPKDIAEKFIENDLKALKSNKPVVMLETLEKDTHGLKSKEIKVVKYVRRIGKTIVGIGGFAVIQ